MSGCTGFAVFAEGSVYEAIDPTVLDSGPKISRFMLAGPARLVNIIAPLPLLPSGVGKFNPVSTVAEVVYGDVKANEETGRTAKRPTTNNARIRGGNFRLKSFDEFTYSASIQEIFKAFHVRHAI